MCTHGYQTTVTETSKILSHYFYDIFSYWLYNPVHQYNIFTSMFLSRKSACVCVHVCLLSRLLITSAMIWIPHDWLNKFYSFYIAAVVIIISRCGLRIKAHHRNQHYKTKLSLYKPFLSLLYQDGALQL